MTTTTTTLNAYDLAPGVTFYPEGSDAPETVRTTRRWYGAASSQYAGRNMMTVRTDEGHVYRLGALDDVRVVLPAAAPAGLPVPPPPASPPGLPAGDHDAVELEAALDMILEVAEGRPVGVDTVRNLMREAFHAGVEWRAGRA